MNIEDYREYCLSLGDALPDRWGRLLLNRREQILATEEKRPLRKLSSFDYLMGIDDYSRMGGFRFKESKDAEFINSDTTIYMLFQQ